MTTSVPGQFTEEQRPPAGKRRHARGVVCKPVTLSLPTTLLKQLDALADDFGLTRSAMASRLLGLAIPHNDIPPKA